MSPSQRDFPQPGHSHIGSQQDGRDSFSEGGTLEDRLCPGCKKPAVSEQGGLVVAFGQSFFHVDCFKCAKCGDQVTADTSLLLLSDGSPICTNCTYSCNVCQQPILDEAIMTGDDSYHAHCFKCKVCKCRIDDLVFAKTSQGIYCMNCHNERMARIRNHVQRKAEREREKRAGGSGSTKSREREASRFHAENGTSSPALHDLHSSHLHANGFTSSRPSSSRGPDASAPLRSPSKTTGPYVSDAFASSPQVHLSTSTKPPLSSYSSQQSFSVTVAPPAEPGHPPPPYPIKLDIEPDRPNPIKQSTLPIPSTTSDATRDDRRRSYDDGVRPLNVLFGTKGDQQPTDIPKTAPGAPDGLQAPTSRRDKRRSINPALTLSDFNSSAGTQASQSTLSPRSLTFSSRIPSEGTQPPSSPGGRDSPQATLSPLREQFRPRSPSVSRPASHDSSHVSNSSYQSASSLPYEGANHSQSPSPSRSTDSHDQTIVITAPSSNPKITLGSVPPSKSRARANSPVVNPSAGGLQGGDARLSAGSIELRSRRSFDDRQRPRSRPASGASLNHESQQRSRSVSPAYRADVPHSVESETDETDPEGENNDRRSQERESLPPAPPPKEAKDLSWSRDSSVAIDADSSALDSGSEELSESSPVERTSHSTFITPALPPIRLSMTSTDFSELFNSMGGFPSRQSLDRLAKISEGETSARTPPPTATNFDGGVTPTAQETFLPPTEEEPEADDTTIRQEDEQTSAPEPPVSQAQDAPLPSTRPLKVNGVFSRPSASNASDSSRAPRVQSPSGNSVSSTTSETDVLLETPNQSTTTQIKIAEPGSMVTATLRQDTADVVIVRLQEAVADARERGAQHLKMDRAFVEAILSTMAARNAEHQQLKSKFDGVKRTSKQYIEGLTVAQTEYDRELKARRDAEAEVTRLRVLLSGQVAKLTALSGDNRKEQLRQQLSKDLHDNLSGLESDLSNLKVERDMALAEVEELEASRSGTSDAPPSNLGRSLTKRLDSLKNQYKRELVPLTRERESLQREIAELKAVRDVFLEETTVLNARNEELAQLSAAYSRRMETVPEHHTNGYVDVGRASFDHGRAQAQYQQQAFPVPPSLSSSTSGSSTLHDDTTMDIRHLRVQKPDNEQHTPSKPKFMKWGHKAKDIVAPSASVDRKAGLEHNFQQLSILRFTRCDHCGDKMWGSQLRCTVCSTSIHVRCVSQVQTPCVHHQQTTNAQPQSELPPAALPPSMFGRDLVEQVRADAGAQGGDRQVPIIVEKCIQAVEALALDYEGIYRKTGGTGQSKAITQLFERGDYMSFDLRDSDRFNDICSVTSVLKNYFRALPVPLLTYDLHDDFMAAVHLKDHTARHSTLVELVNKLPDEHYYTLRLLMLHLNRVRDRAEVNKMNARNLGVVFGPTLMRSRDPAAEFHDMAGKALSIEWLVENAPSIFNEQGHELTGYS
ncbi:putative protein kinase C conserved region 1 (C1) domains (Cysteine-rich domains) [Lyophyllum shimeji]|uniref:RhoGAP-domain-containing protein n=1 Tax=Lyophyllum shimeji TaxID=47721 RepID=A0A9P3PJL0_LYOSH|nr:putative protein kinase C conserved region 1 (C1) domains (Cysteine-rich domains) [Lyophyllum shimeji]